MAISKKQIADLQIAANVARGLALDAVTVAQSGHLGLPLGCAEIGAALFGHLLQLNPDQPRWINRDRFVLSAGHGTMFLYAWLHLSGFAVDELSRFRTQDSNLPGHPEFGITPGVECTTGPLGQGVANAVGFAISEKMLHGRINNIQKILDYRIVCLCGDGCLQEGISHEACSLAGHLRLDNLILIYDSNDTTIDAPLKKTQSEDVRQRFEAYGFFVQTVDGHSIIQIIEAYERAKIANRPSLIIAKTIIGYGISEIEGTNRAHGEIGIKFAAEAKKKLGLPEQQFFVSEKVKILFESRYQRWSREYNRWKCRFDTWKIENEDLYALFFGNRGMEFISENIFGDDVKAVSTREAGGKILNALAEKNPKMVTGSADLFHSNKNYLRDKGDFSRNDYGGRNISFGVREHAMGAILNGMAYDGIFQPSGATFLAFSDYLRPAIRVAAMAKLPVVYIFTHDSIAVGPDGPTHQPVEILAALRSIPNLDVIRPADAGECESAYEAAFSRKNGPTALILSRQDLPPLMEIADRKKGTLRGAYIAREETKKLQLIVLATGSELSLTLEAAQDFSPFVRVVSMPSMEIFKRQGDGYGEEILPLSCPLRLAVEAGVAMPWYPFVGSTGHVISVDDFGFSAPGKQVQEYFGLTVEFVREKIRSLLPDKNSAEYIGIFEICPEGSALWPPRKESVTP
ncbi:MAG: transketolase [Puniceicoccales bacterium]|nr:transketolase [Puniceicoccales bacterium]